MVLKARRWVRLLQLPQREVIFFNNEIDLADIWILKPQVLYHAERALADGSAYIELVILVPGRQQYQRF